LGGVVVDHHVEGRDLYLAVGDGLAQVDQEDAKAACLVRQFFIGRRAREKKHEVAVLGARDEHLLAVDHVAVTVLAREGLDPRRLRAGVRLRYAECLQPQLPRRDTR
jgi:hypothetical protein